jgi:RNA polymerase sigma-70 factor (ECF subfamily)
MSFWEATYDTHAPSILAFLRSRTGRREEAEDLLQETFVRAMRAGVRETGSVRSYLFTIAHHLMINRLRQPRPVLASELEGDEAEPLDALPGGETPTDAAARAGELRRRLAALRATLSPAYRQALDLGILERLPYREIARHTGWTLAQVKINVHRARRRAMEALADFLPEVPA